MLYLILFWWFLFAYKPSSDTVDGPCVTIDLAAHLGERQLNQDKVESAEQGITLQTNPLSQWASDDTIVHIHYFTMKPFKIVFFLAVDEL